MNLKGGGDCIIIPGAQDAAGAVQPDKVCGSKNGLPTATADGMADANSKTVCCKSPIVHCIFLQALFLTFYSSVLIEVQDIFFIFQHFLSQEVLIKDRTAIVFS